uniref:Uncharacterized protein LOC105851360 isoform X2 n=1 Tax=Cicer arietinum TaxID=3827 RepID=A0A3Q7XK84_CICAR|nr:uncharacterized protein LOC105851360 isoform X2 [Cicer arietinum]
MGFHHCRDCVAKLRPTRSSSLKTDIIFRFLSSKPSRSTTHLHVLVKLMPDPVGAPPRFIDSANSSMLLDSFGRVVDISWLLKIIMVLISYESVKLRLSIGDPRSE